MPNTPFHHPYRIDAATLGHARDLAGLENLLALDQFQESMRFLAVNPIVFSHAYLLLGDQPQRFTNDLSLYLATVRTFFEREDSVGGLAVPAVANADSRKRLAEDLGVGLAAFFMVSLFGVTWDTISQIPANTKLSAKRPDFQGFADARRYLFEAKGTTKMASIEQMLSKAIGQVKTYPEAATAKIAIISYLNADDRFFPSTSFVVDPPVVLREGIPSDVPTSRLLHFEKVLQFAGFPDLAKNYLTALSSELKDRLRIARNDALTVRQLAGITTDREERQAVLNVAFQRLDGLTTEVDGRQFVGQTVTDEASGYKIFHGADRATLAAGAAFQEPADKPETVLEEDADISTSVFPDGTILRISKLPKK